MYRCDRAVVDIRGLWAEGGAGLKGVGAKGLSSPAAIRHLKYFMNFSDVT